MLSHYQLPNFMRNLRGLESSQVKIGSHKLSKSQIVNYSEASGLRGSIRLVKLVLKQLARAHNLSPEVGFG